MIWTPVYVTLLRGDNHVDVVGNSKDSSKHYVLVIICQ